MPEVTEPDALNIQKLVPILRRRGWIALLCMLVAGAAAFGASELQTKRYTAVAQLLFRDAGIDVQASGFNSLPVTISPTEKSATNVGLAKLPGIAPLAAQQAGLSPAQVLSSVAIGSDGTSDLVRIDATSTSPAQAARIANAYGDAVVATRLAAARSDAGNAVTLVRRQLAGVPRKQKNQAYAQSLSTRLASLRTLAGLQTGNVALVQRAGVPGSPSSPKVTNDTLLGALVGLVLGLALITLLQRLDRSIRDPIALGEALGLPLVGVVPTSEHFAHVELSADVEASSNGHAVPKLVAPGHDQEAFVTLLTQLRYFNVDRQVQTLLVTSAEPAEGKTTVALNLAQAGAHTGRSVLLIEADLRRPAIAGRLGITGPGLADALTSRDGVAAAARALVHRVATAQPVHAGGPARSAASESHFDVIVAGAVPANPAQLVESEALQQLLNGMREHYDLILVDTPPVGVVADAIPLMRRVDGVLVVGRLGQLTTPTASRLREQLSKLDASVLGVVANDVSKRVLGEAYGYAYTDYYAPVAENTEAVKAGNA